MVLHEYNVTFKKYVNLIGGRSLTTDEERVRAITAQSAVNHAVAVWGAIQVLTVERIEPCTDWSYPK